MYVYMLNFTLFAWSAKKNDDVNMMNVHRGIALRELVPLLPCRVFIAAQKVLLRHVGIAD